MNNTNKENKTEPETSCSGHVEPVVMLQIHDEWGVPRLKDGYGNTVNSLDYFAIIDGDKYHLQGCILSGGCSGHGMGAIPVSGFNAVRVVNGNIDTKELGRKVECVKKAT